MAIRQLMNQQQEMIGKARSELLDVLDVLENRHEVLQDKWQNVLEALPEDCSDDLVQHKILMETEISRYRRYLLLIRDHLLQQENRLLLRW
ncbi:hypothetical protein [Acidithiobacillus sp. AMEEHan]|uniref:hypothetical protein n=1 Tax=Acidithiobacillus sp. AMEEHan TaxID=2994951 RepID=UPI0027E3E2C9|nr:hypothetical protein [Acidithiobacillus sp. AMEEHan]